MTAGAVALAIGGAEAAGFFKEATGFDSAPAPTGTTDASDAHGAQQWGDD